MTRPRRGVKELYHASVKRLLEVVEALDGKDSPHNFEPWKDMVEERSGSEMVPAKQAPGSVTRRNRLHGRR
jgi:hypothetical protein